MANTIQNNIKRNDKDFSEYGLWMGGLDVSNKNIDQFDPLRTGYARLFITRLPVFMTKIDSDGALSKRFKHLVEMGFTRFDGINDKQMETEDITGGYVGAKFQIPSMVRDETDAVTISVYEFTGSPVREFIDTWMTGISDPLTGLSHYHGVGRDANGYSDGTCPYRASNHTMECILVNTDPTGTEIEHVAMFCNMMPKSVKLSHFNYESGSHPAVLADLEFTATKYESPQINTIGALLLAKYKILRDYLDFTSGYDSTYVNDMPVYNLRNI